MGPDGSVGEVEPFADLPVREAFGRQLGDLELLWAQLGPRFGNASACALAGGAQLAEGAVGIASLAEGVEGLGGLTERYARVDVSPLPAQPLPVGELRACRVERPAVAPRR